MGKNKVVGIYDIVILERKGRYRLIVAFRVYLRILRLLY